MNQSLPLLHFKHLSRFSQIIQFVSTRQGGVSLPPFDSLNLGLRTQDSAENVLKNRSLLAEALGIKVNQFCISKQSHTSQIAQVFRRDEGRGALTYLSGIEEVDGLMTHEKEICLMVFSADCTLLLLYDFGKQIIAAVHGGWRGAVNQIGKNAVLEMQKVYDSKPEHILVGISPCIQVEEYEIGKEVEEAVMQNFGTQEGFLKWNERTQKNHLDLLFTYQTQLAQVGILPQNIETMPLSTFHRKDLFFSARRDKNITGRFGAGIMLKA